MSRDASSGVRRQVQERMLSLWQKLRLRVRNEPMWCCEHCRDAASRRLASV
jgi:hypothetical protein